jgi:hypothetical protein
MGGCPTLTLRKNEDSSGSTSNPLLGSSPAGWSACRSADRFPYRAAHAVEAHDTRNLQAKTSPCRTNVSFEVITLLSGRVLLPCTSEAADQSLSKPKGHPCAGSSPSSLDSWHWERLLSKVPFAASSNVRFAVTVNTSVPGLSSISSTKTAPATTLAEIGVVKAKDFPAVTCCPSTVTATSPVNGMSPRRLGSGVVHMMDVSFNIVAPVCSHEIVPELR